MKRTWIMAAMIVTIAAFAISACHKGAGEPVGLDGGIDMAIEGDLTEGSSPSVEGLEAPRDLEAIPGPAEVKLLWTPMEGVTGFKVFWSDKPDDFEGEFDVEGPPFVHEDLINGQKYRYAVAAMRGAEMGPRSAEVSATPTFVGGEPIAILRLPDPTQMDMFGNAVAIDRDVAMVGVPGFEGETDSWTVNYGAVFVYRRSEGAWGVEGHQLERSTPQSVKESFGNAIAIDGKYAVVGARGREVGGEYLAGAAFIFEREADGTWNEKKMLTVENVVPPEAPGSADKFGFSVSINGDYVLIGASGRDGTACIFAGAAYLFKRDGDDWEFVKKFSLPGIEEQAEAWFGSSVALSDDYAVISAPYYDDVTIPGEESQGKAFIYSITTPDPVFAFFASAGSASDEEADAKFGMAVGADGDFVIVGAPQKTESVNEDGAAYFYMKGDSGWGDGYKVALEEVGVKAYLGGALSIFGDYAVISASGKTGDYPASGAVYLYRRHDGNEWVYTDIKLLSPNQMDWARFGLSVDMDDQSIIVGASAEDKDSTPTGDSTGAAYIFE